MKSTFPAESHFLVSVLWLGLVLIRAGLAIKTPCPFLSTNPSKGDTVGTNEPLKFYILMKQVPKEIIQEIADQLGCGFRVFLHTGTLKLITYPDEDKIASFESFMWEKEIQAVRKEKDKYFEIQGMESHDSFRVMEDFIATINDHILKDKLSMAIHQKKPFAHFKVQLDRSGVYRDRWFAFRNQKMIEWVQEQLEQIS